MNHAFVRLCLYKLMLFIFLGRVSLVFGASFVGNGGSAGDVEMLVTLKQVEETFRVVTKKSTENVALCQCNKVYETRALCEPLLALTEEQSQFCTQALYHQAPEMLKLLSQREQFQIVWTNGPIEVTESGPDGQQLRAADAVANRDTGQITVNQKRFLAMHPQERVFLLTHELLHFTQYDGQPMTDEGEMGPFPSREGARLLINAMAAAASVLQGAYPKEIKRYRAKRHRSQAWKSKWIGMDGGSAQVQSDYADRFAFNRYVRGQINLRYQWTRWGVVAAYRSEAEEKTITFGSLDVNAKEELSIFGMGATYRIFVASDPLTFWGQSHFLIQGMVEYIKANYNYGDRYNDLSDQASTLGASLGVSYYLPLFWGFWTYVGTAYEYHPYKYTDPVAQLNLNYHQNLISAYLGVSYAF